MRLTISEQIRELMEREGVSYLELAKRLGKNSKQSVWEKINIYALKEDDAKEIGAALGYEFITDFRRIE